MKAISNASPTVSWTGRYFEDFTVGDVYRHPLGRTVLAADNAWLTLLTQNTAPLHFDAHYAAQTELRGRGPEVAAVAPEWDARALAAAGLDGEQ